MSEEITYHIEINCTVDPTGVIKPKSMKTNITDVKTQEYLDIKTSPQVEDIMLIQLGKLAERKIAPIAKINQ